eukprot:15347969-Ditylum_brightwellii.AAC.1
MGFINHTTTNVLCHLYHNYGFVTPTMMKQAHTRMIQLLNPGMPIKDIFWQINEAQDLVSEGNDPFLKSQLTNTACGLIFESTIHNNVCKELMHLPDVDKTWARFKQHFTEAHSATGRTSGTNGRNSCTIGSADTWRLHHRCESGRDKWAAYQSSCKLSSMFNL